MSWRIPAVAASLFMGFIVCTSAAYCDDAAFVRSVAQNALQTGAVPGIAIAVVRNGHVAYEGGAGVANHVSNEAVTAQTRFAIGSLSKQLTAAAIMILARENRLTLDDPLSKYVPALPNASQITIRMLLHQTSGLHNYPMPSEHEWPFHGPISTSTVIGILASDKPDFAPGTKWEYSNANYAALAAVIEEISGIGYGEFLERNIFAPLGMSESGYGYAAQQPPVATGYRGTNPDVPPTSLDLYSGAGGVVSSAHDFALWDIGLMTASILPETAVQTLWNPATLADGAATSYAMGWMTTTLGGRREVWHNGLVPGAGGYCYNAIFPDDGLAIVIFTNESGAEGLPERIVQTVAAHYGIGTAPAAASASPTAPGDDPEIDALARRFWDQLASNSVDTSTLAPKFAALFTPEFRLQVEQGIAALGELRSFTFIGKTSTPNGLTAYRYELIFASGTEHEWDIWVDADGKIAASGIVH